MAFCASCGAWRFDNELCAHHHYSQIHGDDWALINRIMCDLFHRKLPPPYLGPDLNPEPVLVEGV